MAYPPDQPSQPQYGPPPHYGPPPQSHWPSAGQEAPTPQDSSPPSRSHARRRLVWILVAAAVVVALGLGAFLLFTDGVRSDLSARDQELCGIVLDEDESIGYLSTQVDELIDNNGNFSSEGDAFAFVEVPVGRSENELSSRIANYDEPASAGYIDDPELLNDAKALRDGLFDLQLAADDGGPVDSSTLDAARKALDDIADTCTS